ncbi:MAG: SpoIIE family protein phosphatase [Methanomassiliicoccales archaeon]|nr:SpoIIE family protein phosphatase [Methanomassiliicoccales archaeon]
MTSIIDMLVVLTEMICVIIVVAYVVTRTEFFHDALKGKVTWKGAYFMIILFGLLSIFGTYSGLDILGAKVNVRDIGPMIAGLIGGPIVGLGAGLIGGLHRLSMGGITAVPCSISTVLAGLFGGMIYLSAHRRFVGIKGAVIFAVLMESLHMIINLILVQPWSTAWSIISNVALPMIFANALGMAAFSFIVWNHIHEEETKDDRDRLNGELQREKAELEMAKEIQQSILPKHLPEWGGYSIAAMSRPAREVGGDFYDMFPMQNGERTVIIADVSGKGMPAALYMAVSRTVMRVAAASTTDIGELLSKANVELVNQSDMGMFVTMFGIELNDEGDIDFANAGHNPPMRVGPSGVSFLPEGGVAMGITPEAVPLAGSIRLDVGEMMILYTDGVTDAVGPNGKELGEEGFRSAVVGLSGMNANDALQRLIEAIDKHTGTEPQYDDITIVIVRREA